MGRPSGDCNCHCGSGTGGIGGLPSPPSGGPDPGCDLLCTHGFLFGILAPMEYPSWVNGDNWSYEPDISYTASIGYNINSSAIKLSHNNYISAYATGYTSENISVGSGNRFVLVNPHTEGTQDYNTFSSGNHYILNTSGVPFGVFNPYNSFDSKKMLCETSGVIDLQKFNSYSIIKEPVFTPQYLTIGTNLNPFLFGDNYFDVLDSDWYWHCNYNYRWYIYDKDFPLTLGFRKLSLQHHDTVNNKYYWIPYLNESDPCAFFFNNLYNYWYGAWDYFYYYGGIFLGNNRWFINYDAFNNKYYLDNYLDPLIYIDYADNKYGYTIEPDPEYGYCYYWFVSQNASSTSIFIEPGENVDIDLLSYLSAQGLEINGIPYYGGEFLLEINDYNQWAPLDLLGLRWCEDGSIWGTATTECGYVAPFDIDIRINSPCCGSLFLATITIVFNQTECE